MCAQNSCSSPLRCRCVLRSITAASGMAERATSLVFQFATFNLPTGGGGVVDRLGGDLRQDVLEVFAQADLESFSLR